MYEWILPLLGFFIAILSALTGVGGGVLFIPLLTLSFSFAPSQAVGTSLLVMVFGGIGATVGYAMQRRVYFKAGLLLALAAGPGAILGAYLTAFLPSSVLGLAFGAFSMVLATRMFSASGYFHITVDSVIPPTVACEEECFKNRKRLAIAFGLSFFAGALSGLLGVGGGVLLVPILLLVVFVPVHVAVGTSMFLVTLTSFSGGIQHYALGNIDFTFAALLSAGAFVGALVGAILSRKFSPQKIQLLFAIALIIVGVQMLLKFV
jgi:uncharacterized membrane protein YfcA